MMKSLFCQVLDLVRDEQASELVEWGLIAGLIVVLGAGIFFAVGGDVGSILSAMGKVVQGVGEGAGVVEAG